MTREEATNYLENSMAIDEDDCSRYHNEVLEFVIKALEQEPCEDCVSRAEAKEQAWGLCLETSYDNEKVVEMLDDLPPVTPTRKKGKWYKQNDDYFDWYECSNCGYGDEGELQFVEGTDIRTKYCPCCGARMDKESNYEI